MKTDWELVREVLNATIDACEALEALDVKPSEKGDPAIRWGDFDTGVSVGDFFQRFWRYPEGAQRDIVRLRAHLDVEDQKYLSELGRALINTAAACAEIIGVPPDDLDRPVDGFVPHCGSGANTMRGQLEGIGSIYRRWMVPEIKAAIQTYRQAKSAMEGGE